MLYAVQTGVLVLAETKMTRNEVKRLQNAGKRRVGSLSGVPTSPSGSGIAGRSGGLANMVNNRYGLEEVQLP